MGGRDEETKAHEVGGWRSAVRSAGLLCRCDRWALGNVVATVLPVDLRGNRGSLST